MNRVECTVGKLIDNNNDYLTNHSSTAVGYPSEDTVRNETVFLAIGRAVPEGNTVYVLLRYSTVGTTSRVTGSRVRRRVCVYCTRCLVLPVCMYGLYVYMQGLYVCLCVPNAYVCM